MNEIVETFRECWAESPRKTVMLLVETVVLVGFGCIVVAAMLAGPDRW